MYKIHEGDLEMEQLSMFNRTTVADALESAIKLGVNVVISNNGILAIKNVGRDIKYSNGIDESILYKEVERTKIITGVYRDTMVIKINRR